MRGRFITIEGIDGAGKSTQTANLLKFLKEKGIDLVHTREPGGTPPGSRAAARKKRCRGFAARQSRRPSDNKRAKSKAN